MSQLRGRFPTGVDYIYTLDTTLPVSEGIKEILKTLGEAMVLVILVVFLFLQNWRATLIPMLAVPVSLIGTFAVFPLLGFSVNTLSLFGLVLAIGLVVDDAIVVVEAVEQHIEEGMSPTGRDDAGDEGSLGPGRRHRADPRAGVHPGRIDGRDPGTPEPAVRHHDCRVGAHLRLQRADAVAGAVGNAAAAAQASRGWLARFFAGVNRWLERTTRGYVSLSHGLIRKPLIGIATLAAVRGRRGLARATRLPTSFLPEEDYGYFLINIQLPPAASLDRTDAVARKVDEILKHTEGVVNFNTIVGFSLLTRVTASNNAFYFVQLEPWDERERPALQARAIVNRLNGALRRQCPRRWRSPIMPPSIPGLGIAGRLLDVAAGSRRRLDRRRRRAAAEVPRGGAQAARARRRDDSPFTANVPQVFVNVDREKALRQGVALGDVYQTMQAYLGGLYVNQFNRFGRQWRVFLQAEGDDRMTPEQVGQFYVRNDAGEMVPLSALQSTQRVVRSAVHQPLQRLSRGADHRRRRRRATAPARRWPRSRKLRARRCGPTFSYDWADLSYQERKAAGTSGMTFVLSLVFVFLILAALYESWSLPFSVLLTVPVAVFGAFLGLLLRKFDLDVYGQIGIVMLIGLSAKNAILIVEFAKYRLEEGMPMVEAALEGARLRLRPILMTSFAFILGCVPLWTAPGVRRRGPPHPRHGRHHRHAGGHAHRRLPHSRAVRPVRTAGPEG